MAERFTGAGLAAKPTINLSANGGTVVGTTQLDGSQQINLVAGSGIILTGTSPDSITIQSTGGGGGGSVTAVTTTLSGITITNPTTTPEISGTLGVSSGGTGTTTLADGGILLGSGAGAITATAQPTDGQLLIGSTGTDPVLATLSAGSGISITEGSGTITIAATGGTYTSWIAKGGGGLTTSIDSGDTLEIAGGTGITTTLSGTGTTTPTLTIDVDGSIPTGSGTAGQVTFWDGAASITGDAAFTFNAATTTLDLEGDLQIRDSTIVQGSTNFSAGNQGNNATFDGIAATDFRSCKYVIQITDATAGDYQVTEILLLNDGASGDVVEYGTIYSGSPLGINFNSSLSFGTISPFFTIDTNNAITVDFVRTLLFPA